MMADVGKKELKKVDQVERYKEIQDNISNVLNEMKKEISLNHEMVEKWRDVYKLASESQLRYMHEYLEKMDYVNAYSMIRRLNVLAQRTQETALQSNTSQYLYYMGTFNGILAAYKNTIQHQSEEKTFIVQMQRLIGRAHMKDVLFLIYEKQYIQNKTICEELNLKANLLNKVLKPLEEIDCIYRYSVGRNAFYRLSQKGKNYVKDVLQYEDNQDMTSVEGEIIDILFIKAEEQGLKPIHYGYEMTKKRNEEYKQWQDIKFAVRE